MKKLILTAIFLTLSMSTFAAYQVTEMKTMSNSLMTKVYATKAEALDAAFDLESQIVNRENETVESIAKRACDSFYSARDAVMTKGRVTVQEFYQNKEVGFQATVNYSMTCKVTYLDK